MGSIYPKSFNVRRVAVIGAGPCGLSAAKYLRAQGAFESVVVFEQNSEVGGVWNYEKVAPVPNPVPQTNPFCPPDKPSRLGQDDDDSPPTYPNPMYYKLHANIPKTLMAYSDQPFPADCWVFPSRQTIQDYVVKYSQDVRDLIKFCFQVTSVELQPEDGRDRWRVRAHSTINENDVVDDVFDAVVMANGHYSTPFIPDIKNIRQFHETHPHIITHSKAYHAVEAFKDKKVIVVGNGPSGLDIAYQINKVSKGKTLLSVRHETPLPKLEHVQCEEIAEIVEFLPEKKSVLLKDGIEVTEIDAIVFCTGFMFSFPFLKGLNTKLISNGKSVHGLYKHIFCIAHPTLALSVLNMKIVPFPFSEAQAAVFSAIWSNNLQLPSWDEMDRWSRELEQTEGDAKHIMTGIKDGEYINELHDWAMSARNRGKSPPRWNDEKFWERSIFYEAKMAFEKQGCKSRSLEELGYHYDPERQT